MPCGHTNALAIVRRHQRCSYLCLPCGRLRQFSNQLVLESDVEAFDVAILPWAARRVVDCLDADHGLPISARMCFGTPRE
jgi:hypothetical protein